MRLLRVHHAVREVPMYLQVLDLGLEVRTVGRNLLLSPTQNIAEDELGGALEILIQDNVKVETDISQLLVFRPWRQRNLGICFV